MDKYDFQLDAFFEARHPSLTGLGARLKTFRRQARLTQAELASRAGLHRGTVADLERGRRTNLWFSTARRLATALGLDSLTPLLSESLRGSGCESSIDHLGRAITARTPLHPIHDPEVPLETF